MHPRWRAAAGNALAIVLLLFCDPAAAQSAAERATRAIKVGPNHAVRTIAAAARVARPGDIVEIEVGVYRADVAAWAQPGITIRGVGGRPRLIADGASAEGKAIFVVRADDVVIENLQFEGARVPDQNGAGIRLERGSLTVRASAFLDNEMGILTSNDPTASLRIENCEFGRSTRSHNLYVGAIGKVLVQGSYFHHGHSFHLLKSRARESFVLYNRITDEEGTASYELEFPNGGVAVVLGNIIQQGKRSENPTVVSYGVEGYRWPRNAFVLAHNTIVDQWVLPGRILAIAPAKPELRTVIVNNLLVGPLTLPEEFAAERGNVAVSPPEFVDAAAFDFRLKLDSRLVGSAGDPGEFDGFSLRPRSEYVGKEGAKPLPGARAGAALSPGAVQSVGIAR